MLYQLTFLRIYKVVLIIHVCYFSVEVIHLGPLLSTIFVSLLPLLDDFSVEIGSIFTFLIIENGETLQQFFKELYFVEESEAIVDIHKEIQDVINENG
jgi:hypothetical protein